MDTKNGLILLLCSLGMLTIVACNISMPSTVEPNTAFPAPDDKQEIPPVTSSSDSATPPTESQAGDGTDQAKPDFNSNGFRSPDQLKETILQEVSFFAGGAGCGMKNIGVSDRTCMSSNTWPIVLQVAGVFRVSDQGRPEQYPWWGEKYDSCYSKYQFGDMVYFVAQGYPEGEEVQFSIEGPTGEETYISKVQENIVFADQRNCSPRAVTSAARLSWVINPSLGAGKYTVTVSGKAGQASLDFQVEETRIPNFGVSVGDTSLPLILGKEQKIKLVYSGFQPNETLSTYLYHVDLAARSEQLVRYIDVQLDDVGNAFLLIDWDPRLPLGTYWLLTPAVLPEISAVPDYGVDPALWSVYFYAGIAPDYDPDKLFSSTQNIFLRPSCGSEQKVQAGRVINLQYGPWGTNGMDILNSTKDKIITRLFVNNIEVAGYRSGNVMSMSEVPCGDYLENAYFFYSEAQIGPLNIWDGEEIDIRVDYSFLDTITDGFDLWPRDGKEDLYSPSTNFSQNFKLIVVP